MADKSQIRIVFGVDFVNVSGVDSVNLCLAQGLHKLGYDCQIISFGNSEHLFGNDYMGIPVKRIGGLAGFLRIFFPRGRDWSRVRAWWNRRQAHRWLKEQRPLLLVAGHLTPLWMPKTKGVFQLGVIHAPDAQNLSHAEKYHHLWDLCIGVSSETSQKAQTDIPNLKGRVHTIVNGVTIPEILNIQREREKDVPLRLLYCGRMAQEQKQIFDLITIGEKLIERGVAFELLIAGEGPDSIDFKQRVQHSRLNKFTSLKGALPRDEVYALMHMADVFLLPSAYEGTPMALLEAMARGCIPVCSRGCGGALPMLEMAFPELLFESGNTHQAAEIIQGLSKRILEINRIRHESHALIQQSAHNIDTMIQSYAKFIDKSLEQI
jgi:glycosyltransferase involved in cell wall biosynthesis